MFKKTHQLRKNSLYCYIKNAKFITKNLTNSTVRHWSKIYSDYLSDGQVPCIHNLTLSLENGCGSVIPFHHKSDALGELEDKAENLYQ